MTKRAQAHWLVKFALQKAPKRFGWLNGERRTAKAAQKLICFQLMPQLEYWILHHLLPQQVVSKVNIIRCRNNCCRNSITNRNSWDSFCKRTDDATRTSAWPSFRHSGFSHQRFTNESDDATRAIERRAWYPQGEGWASLCKYYMETMSCIDKRTRTMLSADIVAYIILILENKSYTIIRHHKYIHTIKNFD